MKLSASRVVNCVGNNEQNSVTWANVVEKKNTSTASTGTGNNIGTEGTGTTRSNEGMKIMMNDRSTGSGTGVHEWTLVGNKKNKKKTRTSNHCTKIKEMVCKTHSFANNPVVVN
jgi:hypothetical protein